MFKLLLAATAVAAAFSLPAQAVTLVQWHFETAAPRDNSITHLTGVAPSTGTGVAGGVHASATPFELPSGNGSRAGLGARNWVVGDYWAFAFGSTGYGGLSVTFDQTGNGPRPAQFTLAYSSDGVTFSNFASYRVKSNTWSSEVYQASSTYTIDLSSVTALNDKSSVTLRLVDSSATSIDDGTVSSSGFNTIDNFTVMATPVPEPGSCALLLAGLGAVGWFARRRG